MTATAPTPAPEIKPVTRAKISRELDKLRTITISRNALIVARDKAVQAVNDRYSKSIAEMDAQMLVLDGAVCRWAVDNREAEFGEAKSIVFDSGAVVQFRLPPKSLELDFGWSEQQVVAALKKRGLLQFVRTVESIDRSALIKAIDDSIPAKRAKTFGVLVKQEASVQVKIPMATAGKETK